MLQRVSLRGSKKLGSGFAPDWLPALGGKPLNIFTQASSPNPPSKNLPWTQSIRFTMGSISTQTQTITADNVLRLFPDVNTSLASSHKVPTSDNDLQGYDEEQIRLMEEVCIVLDNDDNPIGSASKKVCTSASYPQKLVGADLG